jgi:hypothetical protein
VLSPRKKLAEPGVPVADNSAIPTASSATLALVTALAASLPAVTLASVILAVVTASVANPTAVIGSSSPEFTLVNANLFLRY